MKKFYETLKSFRNNPRVVKFTELCKVCEFYFGKPRQSGTSHREYQTPWQGDPRVSIQNNKGKAKTYQVKQALRAIERLEIEHGTKE